MSSIRIREYREEDRPDVLEVLRLALGETKVLQRTPQLWAWKHLDNPFGPSVVLVATSGERLVGVRALMRWQLKTREGSLIECARPVDTATHPEFLRQGIFRNLTEHAIDQAASLGIQLIFNTPNAKSKPGYLRMGWKEVGSVGVMVRPSLRLVRPGTTEFGASYVRGASEPRRYPGDRPPRGLRTVRTPAYLKWRFESHPTAIYDSFTVDSTTAFVRSNVRRRRRELIVSDVVGPEPHTAIRAVLGRSSADYTVTWFNNDPERAAARACGLVTLPWFHRLDLVARPIAEVPGVHGRLSDWDLSIGDLELL